MNLDWEEIRNIIAWIMCALAVIFVAWAPVSCSRDSNDRIESAVKAGVDPQEAACAYGYSQNSTPACIIVAAKKGAK